MLGKHNNLGAYLEDTGEVRVKVANFEELAKEANAIEDFLSTFTPDPAFMYLHVIAMGAGEYYGCNKNGDYFPEKSLIMYHHTFEQNAKIFKQHNNKPNSPDYGKVAKSWYNPTMHRVELILAVDKSKAPDIVERIERGEHPELSMGCKVPHDVCSICGNKAAKKPEYCDHIRYENKKVYSDGRQVFMRNLQPTFFDISFVWNRADKIALTIRKVASELGSLDHVFDIEDDFEKEASINKEVPADAVVKVLNQGMFNKMESLENAEPDLPPAMLDRMATKHTLADILTSFMRHMIPMKPREAARIIIIQNGMPLSHYDDVLSGILSARRDIPYELGNYQPEIGGMLDGFMPQRSSYGPFVVRRILSLGGRKLASEKTANDDIFTSPIHDAPYYDPAYATELNHYKYNYSSVPVMYSPEEYRRRQYELTHRPALRKPLNPFAVGLMLGAMYASYRGVGGLKKAVDTLVSDKVVAGAGLATLAAVGAMRGNHKEASLMENKLVTHLALPFVGAHLAAAHYRNKYMRGEELNGVQRFVAENPDYLSIAAPFAMHFGSKKYNNLVGDVASKVASVDERTKLADFADNLSQAALTGIIFRGRGLSGASNIADQAVDGAIMRHAISSVGKTTQPDIHASGKRIYYAPTPNGDKQV